MGGFSYICLVLNSQDAPGTHAAVAAMPDRGLLISIAVLICHSHVYRETLLGHAGVHG
jgi:hypothetical protein